MHEEEPEQEENGDNRRHNGVLKLRYYAPAFEASDDDTIRALLSSIRSKWGIDYEIVEIPTRPGVFPGHIQTDEAREAELYEKHFVPRAALLKFRTDAPINSSLRTNSGRYYLRGTIASEAGVEWHCRQQLKYRQGDRDESVGFLEAVLQRGPELVTELSTPIPQRRNVEQAITDAFIHSGVLPGEIEQQVKIGHQRFETEMGCFDWRRKIDLLIRRDDGHWVIESKQVLNYQAFGQILCYAYLYQVEHPAAQVRTGIVCARVNAELRLLCHVYAVTVFEITEDGVKVHAPESV